MIKAGNQAPLDGRDIETSPVSLCGLDNVNRFMSLPALKEHIETRHQEQGHEQAQGQAADGPGGHGLEHLAAFLQVQGQGDEPEDDGQGDHQPGPEADLGGV